MAGIQERKHELFERHLRATVDRHADGRRYFEGRIKIAHFPSSDLINIKIGLGYQIEGIDIVDPLQVAAQSSDPPKIRLYRLLLNLADVPVATLKGGEVI
jgi:hypothetical protein